MRYAFLLLLSGCSVQYPVWHGDPGVAGLCQKDGEHSYTHRGETKTFVVFRVEHPGDYCGRRNQGCIRHGRDIYVPTDYRCPKVMAHELSHGFGIHSVDRPEVGKHGS